MSVFAAVMTGPGTGAIATIQLFGDSAETSLRKVFKPAADGSFELTPGRILLGHVVDGSRTIDQVTIGCEGPQTYAINCHGNPLIVERIMELLEQSGVTLCRAEQLLHRTLAAREACRPIAVEAKRALPGAKTIEGAKLLTNQIEGGLAGQARQWLTRIETDPLEDIRGEAARVLADSDTAALIIFGATVALIGPPNTGKSTLLNTLAGREKAIVTDIKGTTRDWVSAEIYIPPLAATLIDTAGLDSGPLVGDINRTAQRKSIEMVRRADLILLVLDLSQPSAQLGENLLHAVAGRRIVTVLNKADLPPSLNIYGLPGPLGSAVRVSAKLGTGIEDLIRAIHQVCNVAEFDERAAVAFTDRQRRLLEQLRDGGSREQARLSIKELLHGQLAV